MEITKRHIITKILDRELNITTAECCMMFLYNRKSWFTRATREDFPAVVRTIVWESYIHEKLFDSNFYSDGDRLICQFRDHSELIFNVSIKSWYSTSHINCL